MRTPRQWWRYHMILSRLIRERRRGQGSPDACQMELLRVQAAREAQLPASAPRHRKEG